MNAHTCLAAGPDNTACTRPRAHRGQHVAYADDAISVVATWEATEPTDLGGLLEALSTAHRDFARTSARRDRAVRAVRAAGGTWSQIASVLGISAQGAQKRYGSGEERLEAHESRQAARKAARAARKADTPSEVDPWPHGTVQGTI